MTSRHDTIAAVATPPGFGGLGVVRVSGPRSRDILNALWKGKTDVTAFEPRKLYFGQIQNAAGRIIDRVLAVIMPSPATYTGDDVVEISSHGSPVIVQRILEACLAVGSRLAAPGEFTKRAFINGKLDLAQAEAVADLIHATSEQGARAAQLQLEGRLSAKVKRLHEKLIELRAFVEATIDFPEEDIEMIQAQGIGMKLSGIEADINQLLATHAEGRMIRDGIRVAIIGKPNVGKSSLLNRLAGTERAIVHEIPGTTRDLIEVAVVIDGLSFFLWDTAGLREGGEAIENIGIERTRQAMERADLLLVVIDGSSPLDAEDMRLLAGASHQRTLFCFNKSDLSPHPNPLPLGGEGERALRVSAVTGDGIERLMKKLKEEAFPAALAEGGSAMITNLRHKEALDETAASLEGARESLAKQESAEFCAHHLRGAQEALGRIIGLDVTEAVLDGIFSKFCIGK